MSIARDCSCRIIQSWRKKEDNRKLYILTSRELDGDVRSGIVNASYPDFSYDGEGWKYGLKAVVVTQYEATPPKEEFVFAVCNGGEPYTKEQVERIKKWAKKSSDRLSVS
jgi:hypothetical protein